MVVAAAQALVPGDVAERKSVNDQMGRLLVERHVLEVRLESATSRKDVIGMTEGLQRYRQSCFDSAAAIDDRINVERRIVQGYLASH